MLARLFTTGAELAALLPVTSGLDVAEVEGETTTRKVGVVMIGVLRVSIPRRSDSEVI